MWKMWKRITCGILIAAMVFADLPMSAMAASDPENTETGSSVFGDADGNGILDAKDIGAILQYIVGNDPSGFKDTNADVTMDGVVDLKDLLAIRKRMAENMFSVSFYDGERLIDTLYVEKDSPLKEVPSVGKSSKENAILLGYFTDQACTVPFYAEDPVTEDMRVYAKYQEMDTAAEELNFTSFAQMDQSPDLSFRIKLVSGNIPYKRAAVLEVKDGSDPVELKIDPDGDGCYKVYAPEGFTKGSSYELTLAEGWVFEGKDETIRTAAFSIAMEEVQNLRMNDEIIYIKDTDTINYTVDGTRYEELTSKAVTEKGGDITYGNADADLFENIVNDDILCIYVGMHPDDRDSKQGEQLLDPIVYVKVTAVNSGAVSFVPLDSDDQVRLYDIPDNFPIALKGTGTATAKDDSANEESPDENNTETDSDTGNEEDEDNADKDSDTGNAEDENSTDKDSDTGNAEDEGNTETDSDTGNAEGEDSIDEGSVFANIAVQALSKAAGSTSVEVYTVGAGNEDNAGTGSESESGTPAGENSEDGDSAGADNEGNTGTDSGTDDGTSAGGSSESGDSTGSDNEGNVGTGNGDTTGTGNGDTAGTGNEDNTGTGNDDNTGADNEDNTGTDSGSEDTTPVEGDSASDNIEDTNAAAADGKTWQPDLKADEGTVQIKDLLAVLDLEMYRRMMGDTTLTADDVWEKISVGDFITLYSTSDEIKSEDNLYYAEITEITEITDNGEKTYIIAYKKTTSQAILESMDVYEKALIAGDDLVSEEQKQEIEAQLLSQLEESGFAEDAAYLLGDIITKTDGFRENMSVQEFLMTDDEGNPLTNEEIQLLNLGGSFELTDDVKLKAELITKGDQLHFGNGVQLAIQVKAEFEVEVEEGKMAIELSATFVQEVALSPSVRGGIVTKEILFIPIPVGVEVNAAIDIKNYTAFSFNAEIYTVKEKDKSTWEKIQAICKDPTELLGLEGIPDGLKSGLKTVGDAMDKIKEIKSKIDQASETMDKIEGYKKDLNTLWELVETTGLTTREDWEQMEETLGKTNVASDLLDMMDLTTETDISAEYLDSMQALMDKYVETVQKETDWVKLVDKEIMSRDFYLGTTPIVVGAEVNFIVRADMSIAIGSNLEYEVGKRYNFWFKIGLFKPSAGSSSMDLLDERFAFQFYVMGRLGLKAGIRAKLYVGLGSGKFASVGITAELGPYVKLYGFFVYEYTKYRPANTQNSTSKERMAGALYLDFGLYFMLGFEANALGNLFEYSYDFLDEEISLLTAGEKRYYYQNAYQPQEDDMVIVRDADGNSANGVTMKIPDNTIALSYVDLNTGVRGSETVDYNKYNYAVSNPNFRVDPATGVISVDVPEDTRFMECDLTVTYLGGKMAFSQYDMAVTIPLVWTNLSDDELNEFYTASVRIGNDKDGYKTVWRKRLLKNQPFDLPSDDEIKEMIGWSEAKFTGGTGYGGQATEGLTLIQDTAYNYNVEYKHYSVTVTGIQNADGTTRSEKFTTKYGESFNFSKLAKSGIEIPGGKYMKFAGVKTDAVITVGGKEQVIDLTQAVAGKAAAAIDKGINAKAEYVDDGVTVRFEFTGITHAGVERLVRKGTVPDLKEIAEIVAKTKPEFDIVNITPRFGTVNASTVFQVSCGILTGPKATLVFHENGGSDVEDITKVVGAYLVLPTPERAGYSFDGWYTDDGVFRDLYDEWKMTEGGAELYAKWIEKEYAVTFDVNGGNELDEAEQTRTVKYNGKYGDLPVTAKTSHVFLGWFTEREGGTQITADTSVAITQDKTLYAHWRELKQIPAAVFDFGEAEKEVYSKGKAHDVVYSFDAGGETFTQDSFTVKYMRQGNSKYETGLLVNAGTYNATVSRPADDIYDKFEHTYTAVITIDKAVRTIDPLELEVVDQGYAFVELAPIGDGGFDDLSDEATVIYQARVEYEIPIAGGTSTIEVVARISANRDGHLYDLEPGQSYNIAVEITGDPNYEDVVSKGRVQASTLEVPGDLWTAEGNYDTSWYDKDASASSFSISSAEQLAGLAKLVNNDNISFDGKEINLTADVDLRGHRWDPIGNNTTNFKGTFDGGNHKITGLYINGSGKVGLFGVISGARIQNVLVDHSYIAGLENIGGIVGFAQDSSVIDNCVNYALVIGMSKPSYFAYDSAVGGILGYSAESKAYVVNCVNYGTVRGYGNYGNGVGGIVGYIYSGEACNNANYGSVIGGNDYVGGIVGLLETSDGEIFNNFTVGKVQGSSDSKYVGAVVGRIYYGDADQCYYLQNSASCNGSNRNAVGTETSSLADGANDFNNAYFTSPNSLLSRTCEAGAGNDNLKGALNRWVTRLNKEGNNYATWVDGGLSGYPIPQGSMVSDAVRPE